MPTPEEGCSTSAVLPIDWLYASQEDMLIILDGTGWQVAEFIEDGTGAFVGVIVKA